MRRLFMISCAALILFSSSAVRADDGDDGTAVAAGQFRPRPVSNGEPHFAVGVKAGTLGVGFQVGTGLTRRINLRGGANFFNYNDSLTQDGVLYKGTLQLRSVEAKVDLFVVGGFRVTPGLLLYNNNNVSATATVPNGTSITLGGVSYTSNPADPLHGNASIGFSKFAPTLGIGFGNLLPRSARHWSLSTDIGVAFSDSPAFALGLTGSACVNNGTICQPATTPSVAANVEAQRVKIQNDIKDFKYYPEVSLMFGWKF
jgi:hypothetical protein